MIKTVTIAAAGTKSGEQTTGVEQDVFVALTTDSAWTTSDITFEASYTTGGSFYPIIIAAGTAYTLTSVDASTHNVLDPNMFLGAKYIKVVSTTTQVAETVVTLISRIVK